jgi:hypothetical protein
VGRNGLKPDPRKIEKVQNLPVPTKVSELRTVLGLFSYYRKFMKGFSTHAKPLYDLLKKDTNFVWEEKQQKAFDFLKEQLTKAPILQYPDFYKPFILLTDASATGLGAVLSQMNDDGTERVIAYASKSLTGAEVNYCPTDLECLAVVWEIRHFNKYLQLQPFKVVTDHSALKYLKNAKLPNAKRPTCTMDNGVTTV